MRVLRSLQASFSSPKVAEKFFESDIAQGPMCESIPEDETPVFPQADTSMCDGEDFPSTPSDHSLHIDKIDNLVSFPGHLALLSQEDKIQLAYEVFSLYLSSRDISVPEDFLTLLADGMVQLKKAGRSNMLYSLAKGLGTTRQDGSDSLFPCRQVVAGLVEHCVNFFTATYVTQVCFSLSVDIHVRLFINDYYR